VSNHKKSSSPQKGSVLLKTCRTSELVPIPTKATKKVMNTPAENAMIKISTGTCNARQ